MLISQKCQYGLRALFELAKNDGRSPVKTAEVAEAQAVPARFLEVILGQLKHGGFVESRRSAGGGYLLARAPEDLAIGEVIRFLQGPLGPVHCLASESETACPLQGRCVFLPMGEDARAAMAKIFDERRFSEPRSAGERRAGGRRPVRGDVRHLNRLAPPPPRAWPGRVARVRQ